MDAENALKLLKAQAEELGSDLQKYVAGMLSSGAAAMMKIDRDSTIFHVSHLAHATKLCACDVIHKHLEAQQNLLSLRCWRRTMI